ncbi:MAG: class I SAM-dependent RNA methyltransferase [Actinobacteria bacterium]|nr:class I SAM-dependent RNA methyltransferase [Actinomycetota bacterium]
MPDAADDHAGKADDDAAKGGGQVKRPGHQVGDLVRVTIGNVAHGGHCVARDGNLVIFVRHALPGEDVTVRITQTARSYARAEVIDVHEAHPGRIRPPCPAFGPEGCGGCDFLHATSDVQRELKLQVLREALQRHGGLPASAVEELTREGIIDLGTTTGWRTRMRYRTTTVDVHGEVHGVPALRAYRSDDVVDASSCVIADATGHAQARERAADIRVPGDLFMARDSVESRVMFQPDEGPGDDQPSMRHRLRVGENLLEFHTPIDGFWQVHPELIGRIVDTVLAWGAPESGERWWDLYAGVGPIAAALADRVGPSGHVVAVESSPIAADEARRVLETAYGHDVVAVQQHDVRRWIRTARNQGASVDGVVLDPPRTGAGKAVIEAMGAIRPGRIVIVACDPVALGRDTQLLAGQGYRLAGIRAWDAFPQTHHLESIAHFLPDQIS